MTITSRGIQLSVRLDSIVYPVDADEFILKLNEKEGYAVAQPGRSTPKGIPMQKGDTFFKGDVILRINPTSLTIALIGLDGQELFEVLNEIITIFDECDGDSQNNIKYFEMISQHEVATEKNALNSIAKYLDPVPTSEIDEILGSKSELFTIKFTPKDRGFTTTEYYEVVFEPLKRNFGKSYFSTIEYRTKKKEKLENFLVNIEDNITKLISIIEQ